MEKLKTFFLLLNYMYMWVYVNSAKLVTLYQSYKARKNFVKIPQVSCDSAKLLKRHFPKLVCVSVG